MTVIVLGLMAMFTQTQRAFRLGMSQTDVLEAGRMATGLITREMQQITPTYQNAAYGLPVFYSQLVDGRNSSILPLTGGNALRTNILSDFFFITRENQTWTGIGYFVRTNFSNGQNFGPVGTLYRYEADSTASEFQTNAIRFINGFNAARNGASFTNVSKILDGVVDLEIRAFDMNGFQITPFSESNIRSNAFWSTIIPDKVDYQFYSNAVPAFVELELGVLESGTYEQYKAIPVNTLLQQTFLQSNVVTHVHLFRQRIPIRNVDVTAYQ